MTAAKTVVLVDGNSIVYRAYFALIRNPLRNSRGENTSAVFGFANSLRKMLDRLKPDYAAVVFDAPGKTFRHDLFENYKVQRPRTPDDLLAQLPAVRELVSGFGIRQFEVPGVEADDVLGTLARRFSEEQLGVFIVTSDKDLLQLVDDRVTVFDPFREVIYDPAAVKEKFGVGPERIADLLALSGDSSDNIPGVPGVGPKRAQEILLTHGTLDAAIELDPRVKPHAEIARVSKSLTAIHTDVAVTVSVADLELKPRNEAALVGLYKRMEFAGLLRELGSEEKTEIRVVGSEELDSLKGRPVVGIALAGDACFVAGDPDSVVRLSPDDERLRSEILLNPNVLKVGFDLKPALKYWRARGVEPKPFADLMIAEWLLDSNLKRYSLEGLMLKLLNRVSDRPSEPGQAAFSVALWERARVELDRWQLVRVFEEIEMPVEQVLAGMELRGVRLDRPVLAEFSQRLAGEIAALEKGIQQKAGIEFNPKSPQQLAHVLFDVLKLKPRRRTKTGFSTDARVLQELAPESPLVADILQWREFEKLQSTYLEPLMSRVDAESGRIHTTFNQTGAATGRLSASEPNLQNVPIRSELGRQIRRAFVAAPGSVLISADYSQIELRVLAVITGDENLKEAFRRGEDIHARTACAVLGCTEKEVTPEARRIAKMVNYGLIYGMSDFGLASRLGLEREASRAFIDAYLSLYPKVAEWTRAIPEQTKAEGVARTLFGRIRPLPDLNSKNQPVYEAARRAAINTPVQGTAADIIKLAMIAVDQGLAGAGFRGGMVLQIHDELLLEIEQERAEEAVPLIRQAMERVGPGDVPLRVDIGVGANWAEAH